MLSVEKRLKNIMLMLQKIRLKYNTMCKYIKLNLLHFINTKVYISQAYHWVTRRTKNGTSRRKVVTYKH